MDMDVVLVLLLTLIAHCSVAYGALMLFARRAAAQLRAATEPAALAKRLVEMLGHREVEGGPTLLDELSGALGQYIGRYIAGMMGRASRGAGNEALAAAAVGNPLLAAVMKVPGVGKLLNHPIAGQFIGPALEGIMRKQAEKAAEAGLREGG